MAKLKCYIITYTSFKGTKFANSGMEITGCARDIPSVIKKTHKILGQGIEITKVEKK